jgi:hypothetical protein
LIPASVFIASFLRRNPFLGCATIELQSANRFSKLFSNSNVDKKFPAYFANDTANFAEKIPVNLRLLISDISGKKFCVFARKFTSNYHTLAAILLYTNLFDLPEHHSTHHLTFLRRVPLFVPAILPPVSSNEFY